MSWQYLSETRPPDAEVTVDSPAKTRIMVLVTDGGNNAGEIDPL